MSRKVVEKINNNCYTIVGDDMYLIKDYLKFYKDTSFKEVSFNEIDNILFSELSYLNFKNIITNKKISINSAINLYLNSNNKDDNTTFIKEIIDNIKIIKDSKRYINCYLFNYVKEVNTKKQFGAVSIQIDCKTLYISYEGTDSSMSGWKENFEICYNFPTLSMKDAIKYLNQTSASKYKTIYVGGHSKGGNLAVISSTYAKKSIKKKIKYIYSNDGPGVPFDIYKSKEYKEIVNKIKLYMPGNSYVGTLLYQPKIEKVIKSNNFSIWEHDCNSWEVFGSFFIEGKLTKNSKDLNIRSMNFLKEFDVEKRKEMVETIFKLLAKCNVKSVSDLKKVNLEKFKILLLGVKDIDENTKKLIFQGIKKLLFNEKNVTK